jgi:hypothetical protein
MWGLCRRSARMKNPVHARLLHSTTNAMAILFGLAMSGALVRLLPLILEPQIAFITLWPFARAILALAVEATLILSGSIGVALALGGMRDRGELRALLCLGQSPIGLLRHAMPWLTSIAIATSLASYWVARDAIEPGLLINGQLARAREACRASDPVQHVPFVNVSVVCGDKKLARFVGQGPARGTAFVADQIHVAGDLRSMMLEHAELALPLPNNGEVHLRVAQINLRGMQNALAPSTQQPWARALCMGMSAWLVSLVLFWLLRTQLMQRAHGTLVLLGLACSGPITALLLSRSQSPWMLGVTPCAAALATSLACFTGVHWQNRQRQD